MNQDQLEKLMLEKNLLIIGIERLEDEANVREAQFEDSCRNYGSELAGSPNIIEIKRNEAKKLRRKVSFLERILRGENFKTIDEIKANIASMDKQIESLNSAKIAMWGEISLLQYLEGVIGKSA